MKNVWFVVETSVNLVKNPSSAVGIKISCCTGWFFQNASSKTIKYFFFWRNKYIQRLHILLGRIYVREEFRMTVGLLLKPRVREKEITKVKEKMKMELKQENNNFTQKRKCIRILIYWRRKVNLNKSSPRGWKLL